MGPLPAELNDLLQAREQAVRAAAWRQFVKKHTPLLLHVAGSLGGDRDAVMDRYAYVLDRLHEEDFVRLRRFQAEGRSRFTTWLVVVVRRLCLDHERRRYGRRRGDGRGARDDEEWGRRRRLVDLVGEEVDVTDIAADGSDPEQVVRRRQRDRALQAALETLSTEDRLLLTLRLHDELSAARVADVLNLPSPFHVYRRVNRVLQQLRSELIHAGVTESSA